MSTRHIKKVSNLSAATLASSVRASEGFDFGTAAAPHSGQMTMRRRIDSLIESGLAVREAVSFPSDNGAGVVTSRTFLKKTARPKPESFGRDIRLVY